MMDGGARMRQVVRHGGRMASLHPRLRRHIFASCFAVCVLLVSTSAAHAAFPGFNGKIAYSHCDSWCTIWTMDADGSHQAQVSPGGEAAGSPADSAGGSRITHTRCPAGGGDAVLSPGASGAAERTPNSDDQIYDGNPAVSPDGKTVVFSRCVLHGDCTIW